MKSFREYLKDIDNGIPLPNYISSGGEDSCDVCGGDVTWPPTGEPCQGVCDAGCGHRLKDLERAKALT